MEKHERFIDALNYRRSVRVYDESREIEDEVVKKCVQQATLAPNSSNMQLWEFHHVTSEDLIKKLAVACLGQPAATYRQLRQSDMRIVAHKSAALAAQTFMLGMAAEGYDTCPMEGSDTLRIKKVLKLPLSSEINMVISCGIRKPEGVYGARFRIPSEEVYKHW